MKHKLHTSLVRHGIGVALACVVVLGLSTSGSISSATASTTAKSLYSLALANLSATSSVTIKVSEATSTGLTQTIIIQSNQTDGKSSFVGDGLSESTPKRKIYFKAQIVANHQKAFIDANAEYYSTSPFNGKDPVPANKWVEFSKTGKSAAYYALLVGPFSVSRISTQLRLDGPYVFGKTAMVNGVRARAVIGVIPGTGTKSVKKILGTIWISISPKPMPLETTSHYPGMELTANLSGFGHAPVIHWPTKFVLASKYGV